LEIRGRDEQSLRGDGYSCFPPRRRVSPAYSVRDPFLLPSREGYVIPDKENRPSTLKITSTAVAFQLEILLR
jgi:hypothetical protein